MLTVFLYLSFVCLSRILCKVNAVLGGLVWLLLFFCLLRWMRSRLTGLSCLLLCLLLVSKTSFSHALRFFPFFYETLPNINNNFIPTLTSLYSMTMTKLYLVPGSCQCLCALHVTINKSLRSVCVFIFIEVEWMASFDRQQRQSEVI